MLPEHYKLPAIFMPRAMRQFYEMEQNKDLDFVHYTSAQNFINIMGDPTPSLWMRNARCMNDLSEIEHGRERIDESLLKDNRRERIRMALNACHPNVGDIVLNDFDKSKANSLNNSYISCVSEHDASENDIGRLSMWRAYGQGSVGIAMVLNKYALLSETNYLNIFASPVSYINNDELDDDVENIIQNINEGKDFLSKQQAYVVHSMALRMLVFGMNSLKHRGFREEREWRIIHTDNHHSNNVLKKTVQTIGGIPQKIFKFDLKRYDGAQGVFDISPNKLLKQIIIGPSNYPEIIRDAIIETLNKVGVASPQDRVVISDIPLRMLI